MRGEGMKISWKKIIAAAGLGISVFVCAGCSSKKTTEVKENKDTLKICTEHYYLESIKNLIDAWECMNKGVKAEMIVLPRDSDEKKIKIDEIRTEILSGGGPDVFVLSGANPNGLEEIPSLFSNPEKAMHTGVFMPLDHYIEHAKYFNPEHYNQVVMDVGKTKEGQCLLPIAYTYNISYFEEPQKNPVQMPLPSWENLVSGKSEVAYNTSLNLSFHFFDVLGEYADYENKKLLISEEELFEYVRDAVAFLRDVQNSSKKGESVQINAKNIENFFSSIQELKKDPNSLLAIPNREGGINANVSVYAGINKNTTKPTQAFSILDLLFSDEVMSGRGFKIGHKFWGNTANFTLEGVTTHVETLNELCKLLPDNTEKALKEINSQVNGVRVYSDLDSDINIMYQQCCTANNEEEQRKIVAETYERMELKLAE